MEPQEKILKTSLDLFFKYGIKRVTMDEIAKELGMSKKTIYQYYKEKDDLVNQLFEIELHKHQKKFEDVYSQAKNPIHEIMLISDNMREMMQNINPIFFLDLQKFHPIAFKQFQAFKENCAFKDILRNIKKGKEEGYYMAEIDEEFVARYRLAQIDILMFGNHFSFDKISFTKSHELILDMFVYGICTVKGHKLINNYKKIKDEE
ncbi:MAG: TetR/AcrR family transcriptional regulator [Bacteroidota bacterium]|nr:TetR/AcrR family transcriptional regulator [Bacteroidota bacterium]MDP3147467.1 TetR/AcrR family transcriptional regulator [Bacteroidota bacterium]